MFEGNTLAVIGVVIAVLNLLLTSFGSLVFIIRLEGKMNVQTVRIKSLETSTQTVASVVTNNAVQDQKILQIERGLDALRRGEGYIKSRDSVNGEYG